jgi:hypothetical protein
LETEHVAGRIYDYVEREFGDDNIFFDVENIPLGVDFRDYIRSSLRASSVVLAVVGRKWLRRSFSWQLKWLPVHGNEEDFARIEIELAIENLIRIFPLLVDGAAMPKNWELPPSISQFSYLNAKEVRGGADFRRDMADVIQGIKSTTMKQPA